MILFFDTETAGLPSRGMGHLVQLAALLTDEAGRERASLCVIVKPNGFTIPDDVARIHGITTEIAQACGVELATALGMFLDLLEASEEIVAHNLRFDTDVIMQNLGKLKDMKPPRVGRKKFCTMEAASPIVNLPPTDRMLAAGYNKPKPPRLGECIKYFFGEDLAGAHDALVDVRACKRLYFHLQELASRPVEPPPLTVLDAG